MIYTNSSSLLLRSRRASRCFRACLKEYHRQNAITWQKIGQQILKDKMHCHSQIQREHPPLLSQIPHSQQGHLVRQPHCQRELVQQQQWSLLQSLATEIRVTHKLDWLPRLIVLTDWESLGTSLSCPQKTLSTYKPTTRQEKKAYKRVPGKEQ